MIMTRYGFHPIGKSNITALNMRSTLHHCIEYRVLANDPLTPKPNPFIEHPTLIVNLSRAGEYAALGGPHT